MFTDARFQESKFFFFRLHVLQLVFRWHSVMMMAEVRRWSRGISEADENVDAPPVLLWAGLENFVCFP